VFDSLVLKLSKKIALTKGYQMDFTNNKKKLTVLVNISLFMQLKTQT